MARRIRDRQAYHQQAVLRQLGRFGQHLGEGELGLETAGRQSALVVELARVGDPLVHQVVEPQHRVRLGAAEVGLRLDHWITGSLDRRRHRSSRG